MSAKFTNLYGRIVMGCVALMIGVLGIVGGIALFSSATEMQLDTIIWDGTFASSFASGDGTEQDPYIIQTAEQLARITRVINNNISPELHNTKDVHYKLESDVFLNDVDNLVFLWNPIGSTSTYPFKANFDGNNHVIRGMYINRTTTDFQGLFGYVSGKIQNVTIADGDLKARNYVGAIVAQLNSGGTVTYCHNKIPVTSLTAGSSIATSTYVGGVVGNSSGVIKGCSNAGKVTGCGATGTSNNSYTGGIVGFTTASATDSYTTGAVTGGTSNSYSYTGGIVGFTTASVTDSYTTGAVTGGSGTSSNGSSYTGGIVGNSSATITNSYNTGTVTGGSGGVNSHTGGILGYTNSATITNSYNTGTVTGGSTTSGSSNTGGIVGYTSATITSSYNTASVTGASSGNSYSYTGGIVGSSSTSITNSHNTGAVTGGTSNSGSYTGGIAGAGTVYNSYNLKKITGGSGNGTSSGHYLGGLIGDGSAYNSFNAAAVASSSSNGNKYTGGLAGGGSVYNCYNSGAVSATGTAVYLGGVIGLSSGTITHSYFLKTTTINASLNVIGAGNAVKDSFSFNENKILADAVSDFGSQILLFVLNLWAQETKPPAGVEAYRLWQAGDPYPEFIPFPVTISFVTNGAGTMTSLIVPARAASLAEYEPDAPVRVGYDFDGWYKDSRLTELFDFETEPAPETNITLYAKWTIQTYMIVYNMNGQGTAPLAPTQHTFGTETSLADAVPEDIHPNQTFIGWSLTDGGEIITSIPATAVEPILWANWGDIAFLNNNGGEGGDECVTAVAGEYLPEAVMPTRTGYTFHGYYDTKDKIGGTMYYSATGEASHAWDKTDSSNLWARWTANEYTVTLDRNGGSGGTEEVTATYDSMSSSITKPVNLGYFFEGYFDIFGDKGGKQYFNTAGESTCAWDKLSNATLWARWKEKGTYIITLDNNGETSTLSYTWGGDKPDAPPANLFLADHKFNGWFYAQKEINASNWEEFLETLGSNVTLYAKFTPYPVITLISFNNAIIGNITVAPDITLESLKPENPTRTGYTFMGWYKEATYANSFSFETDEITRHTNLYAKWTEKKYKIAYNAVGGIAPTQEKIIEWGATYALGVPSKNYHSFDGWFTVDGKQLTDKNGNGGANIWNTDTNAANNEVEVFAHWTPYDYAMRFDTDGGDIIPQVLFGYGTTIPSSKIPQNPTKPFATFKGWFTADGQEVNFETLTMPADGITIKAKWSANTKDLEKLFQDLESYVDAANYDQSLHQNFIAAFNNAKRIIDAPNSTIAQIEDAFNKLNAAVTALESGTGGNTPQPNGVDPLLFVVIGLGVVVLALCAGFLVVVVMLRKPKQEKASNK